MSENVHQLFPSYIRAIATKDDTNQVLRILARPTCFISDGMLMEQLSPVDSWSHISSGYSGSIFVAKWLGVNVVVKWCNDNSSSITNESNESLASLENDIEIELENFQEMLMTSALHHPNIVSFYVASPSAIVLEQLGASLAFVLKHSEEPHSALKKQWCHDIVSAVRYLHCFDILHGDISTDNFAYSLDGKKLKLIDFGGSVLGMDNEPRVYRTEYLPLTMQGSQEQFGFSCNIDVYATCCVLLQIVFWTAELFDVFDLPFFERQYMNAADKKQYLNDSQAHAQENIMTLFETSNDDLLSPRLQNLLMEGLKMGRAEGLLEQLQQYFAA